MVTCSPEEVQKEIQEYPVKCDHCPFTGKVADAKLVDGKACCPLCGGSLAGNSVKDQIMDAARDCGILDLLGNGDDR